jgi:DNA-binding XRE family transcriptional regulator
MPRAERDPALAAVLKRLREEHDEAQESLAHRAGISKGALQEIEAGRSAPGWATVRRIARALDVSMEELGAAVDAADH